MRSEASISALNSLGCLLSGRLAPEAIDTERWPAIIDMGRQQGLDLMLLCVAARAGIDVDREPAWQSTRWARREVAIQQALALSTQERVQDALIESGVSCVWLKGISLASTIYPEPDLRPMIDLDVLVPYARRREALAAVQALDFALVEDQMLSGLPEFTHHYYLKDRRLSTLPLELHYRLLDAGDVLLTLEQLDWFWGQTESYQVESRAYQGLTPEANLLYLSAHAVLQHGVSRMPLLRVFDIHLLIEHCPDLDWKLVLDKAVELRWTYAVERCLSLAVHYFSSSVPADFLEDLAAQRLPDEDVTLATRWRPNMTLWQTVQAEFATRSWQDRVQWAGRLILPPSAYMRWRYQVDAGWKLPAAYATRWVTIVTDIGRSIFVQARTRSTDRRSTLRDDFF